MTFKWENETYCVYCMLRVIYKEAELWLDQDVKVLTPAVSYQHRK